MIEAARWIPGKRLVRPKGYRGQSVGEDNFLAELFDAYGVKQDERRKSNTVYWAKQTAINNLQTTVAAMATPGWMAVGTGALAAVSAQATDKLTAENARVALTSKTQTANTSAVLTMVGNFPAGTGTGALIEAGVFTVVTANTVAAATPMQYATTFAVINKGASDTLQITWTYTLS